MAKLFKWTERAERKFNKTIMGVNPLCLLQHFIVLAVWERFNQCIKPEYLSIAEVRAKLESIYNEIDLGDANIENMFPEEEFSLPLNDFPGCQNNDSDNEDETEFNINNLLEGNDSGATIEKAGPSSGGVSKRKLNKKKKGHLGKNKNMVLSKTNKKRRL